MSLIVARKKRTSLYLSIAGLLLMVAAVSAISAEDPSGVSVRVGMIMITVGAALWLPWRQLIPAVVLAWLVPNIGRSLLDDVSLGSVNMLLELPGLAGVGFFTWMARDSLKRLEQEHFFIGTGSSDLAGLNPESGIFDENQLQPALTSELARSRRFGRTFSLVLVGIDEMRQKFDYRDEALLSASRDATVELLRQTRLNVDRVFHYKGDGYAIILPETTEKDIPGLVKRLRRLARSMKPAEGEPGGPIPVHYGATFFPDCATTVEDLIRRAEVALRTAGGSTTRYQIDSAEAPQMPPVESLRRLSLGEKEPETAEAPPAISNPVAAAIVDEAYAERAREAQGELEAAPVVSTVGAAEAEPVMAALEESETADESEEAGLATAPVSLVLVDAVAEADAVPEAETPTLALIEAAYEDFTSAPYTPEQEPQETIEVLAAASMLPEAVSDEPEAVPVAASAAPVDDFEALLAQMDETLKMIRTVRSHAA